MDGINSYTYVKHLLGHQPMDHLFFPISIRLLRMMPEGVILLTVCRFRHAFFGIPL